MHAAPRRQSTGALAAWPDPAGYWPTDGEEGGGGGWAGAGSICERHQKNLIFVFNTDNKRLSFAVAERERRPVWPAPNIVGN